MSEVKKNEAKIEVTVKKVNNVIEITGASGGRSDLIIKGIASTINDLVTKMVKDENDPEEYVETLNVIMKKLNKEVVECKIHSIVNDLFKDMINAFDEDEDD